MYKFERREKKLQSKRTKMPKHGRKVGDQYNSGVIRDLRKAKERMRERDDRS